MIDMWDVYAHIQDINNGIYMHAEVNHSHHFVNPNDPDVHTQMLKTWMCTKQKLKWLFGTSPHLFPSYLEEFTFCNAGNENVSIFARFIRALQKDYL